MEPIVNGLTDEFQDRATVLQLNAADADNAALQRRYGLRGHPTFAVLNGAGEVTGRFVGPQEGATLRAALEAVVGSTP